MHFVSGEMIEGMASGSSAISWSESPLDSVL